MKFQDENDLLLPSVINLESHTIWLHRLVCFTNDRFMRTIAEAVPEMSTQSRAKISMPAYKEHQAIKHAVAIMNGEPPPKMSVHDVERLLDVSRQFLAFPLMDGLDAYLLPMIDEVSPQEVRTANFITDCKEGLVPNVVVTKTYVHVLHVRVTGWYVFQRRLHCNVHHACEWQLRLAIKPRCAHVVCCIIP